MHTLLIVGGSGFLGSSITKTAVASGWKVISISKTGKPYVSPAGHRPAWSTDEKVEWHAADALQPETYSHLMAQCTAVVHTVGILLESDYKKGGLLQGLLKGWTPSNPLGGKASRSYEIMNRDSAIAVASTFLKTRSGQTKDPFIYISAEDLFRPVVDERYIKTKRQAEQAITTLSLCTEKAQPDADGTGLAAQDWTEIMRPVYMRPGLMYHPHTRPISTLPAAILEASAAFHNKPPLPLPLATPASFLARYKTLSPLARLLTTPPLHVDTVAKAVCKAIEDDSVRGPITPKGIQRLAGWKTAMPQHRSFSTRPCSTTRHRSFFNLASKQPTVYATTKIINLPRPLLFATVLDVSSYASFVPYCQKSKMLSPTTAELTVGFGSFNESYISQVGSKPNEWVTATAQQPNPVFEELKTIWTFEEVGKEKTKVGFKVEYMFRNSVYGAVAGRVLEKMSIEMVDAFEKRAEELRFAQSV